MKIAFVIPGGVDRSGRDRVVPMFLWLIERIARRHELHVFVLDYYHDPITYPLLGAVVHDLGRTTGPPGMRRWIIERKLEAAVREHGPFDVLHGYWGVPAGIATTRVARRLGTPAVVTFDSGELVRIDDILYGLQLRWINRRAVAAILRDADAISVPTTFMSRFPALAGVHPHVIPMGIDHTRFPFVSRADGPPWRLIRVASVNLVKDYPALLETMRRLVSMEPAIHLDIVGEDMLGGAMQSIAASIKISAHVTFHGVQPTERVAELYAGAHLNVVTSRHESANVTVLEAAATGLATAGFQVGYLADWHPDKAIAVPVGDVDGLAAAIRGLLQDRRQRDRIAAAAREWTITHDADWTADAFGRLFHRVLDDRHAGLRDRTAGNPPREP
jgi:glycosyltransferase involved in cell wall biosynthesis